MYLFEDVLLKQHQQHRAHSLEIAACRPCIYCTNIAEENFQNYSNSRQFSSKQDSISLRCYGGVLQKKRRRGFRFFDVTIFSFFFFLCLRTHLFNTGLVPKRLASTRAVVAKSQCDTVMSVVVIRKYFTAQFSYLDTVIKKSKITFLPKKPNNGILFSIIVDQTLICQNVIFKVELHGWFWANPP